MRSPSSRKKKMEVTWLGHRSRCRGTGSISASSDVAHAGRWLHVLVDKWPAARQPRFRLSPMPTFNAIAIAQQKVRVGRSDGERHVRLSFTIPSSRHASTLFYFIIYKNDLCGTMRYDPQSLI